MPKLSVIVPVYNELPTIEEILDRIHAAPLPEGVSREVIVVDDGSTDRPDRIFGRIPDRIDRLIVHDRNRGKGAAVRSGLAEATGDFVVIQDADLEYDPREFAALLRPLLEETADVVYGSRFAGTSGRRVLYFWHTVANRFLTWLSNAFTNLNLTDILTCHKMIRRSVLEGLVLQENGFGIESEITAKLAHRRIRFYEIGISYSGRTYSEGKKIRLSAMFRAVYAIIRYSWFYRPQDVGKETLEKLESYSGYARLIMRQFSPHLGARVLEFGSGIGSLARDILEKDRVVLTDVTSKYVEELNRHFGRLPHVTIRHMDICRPDEDLVQEGFDSVFSSNVLEHIENDKAALRGVHSLLRPGGNFVILVPAFMSLYSPLDRNLDHYRRYTKRMLIRRLRDAGFDVEDIWYWNPVGAIGWFVAGRLFRQQTITDFNILTHRLIEPGTRLIDRLLGRRSPFGLSVIAVARKPAEETAGTSVDPDGPPPHP